MLSCFPQKLGPSTKTKHTRSLQHQRLGCVGIQSVSDVSGFNLLGTCYYNALYIYIVIKLSRSMNWINWKRVKGNFQRRAWWIWVNTNHEKQFPKCSFSVHLPWAWHFSQYDFFCAASTIETFSMVEQEVDEPADSKAISLSTWNKHQATQVNNFDIQHYKNV